MFYHAAIVPDECGRFLCSLEDSSIFVRSYDPEYDLCLKIMEAGLDDGGIQFFRDGVKTLFFPSVLKASQVCIEMGNHYPYRISKRWKPSKSLFRVVR